MDGFASLPALPVLGKKTCKVSLPEVTSITVYGNVHATFAESKKLCNFFFLLNISFKGFQMPWDKIVET